MPTLKKRNKNFLISLIYTNQRSWPPSVKGPHNSITINITEQKKRKKSGYGGNYVLNNNNNDKIAMKKKQRQELLRRKHT